LVSVEETSDPIISFHFARLGQTSVDVIDTQNELFYKANGARPTSRPKRLRIRPMTDYRKPWRV